MEVDDRLDFCIGTAEVALNEVASLEHGVDTLVKQIVDRRHWRAYCGEAGRKIQEAIDLLEELQKTRGK